MTAVRKKSPKTAPGSPLAAAEKTAAPPPVPAPASFTLAEQHNLLFEIRVENARIPQRFATKDLSVFEKKSHKVLWNLYLKAIDYVRLARESTPTVPGAMLKGVVGCGKTHFAVALLRRLLAEGFSGLYFNMIDLLVSLRETYSDNSSTTEAELLDEVIEPDFLVLDDLGAERTSDWVNDRLYHIVNSRYDRNKPLIVTTNLLEYKELASRVGERTASRLAEMCEDFPPFPDEDYRRKHMK